MARPSILDDVTLAPGIVRFWLIRHAVVEQNARAKLYGVLDVPLCPESLVAQEDMYRALARRLPAAATWVVSPLSRTRITADQIGRWRDEHPSYAVEPGLMEQDLGQWQGLSHAALPPLLARDAHPFWPAAADEKPPGGESFDEVCARVGPTLERLADAHDGREIVAVSHGGAIRAAVAHALDLDGERALRLSVQNLSVTVLERHRTDWRVVCLNELPGV